MQKTLKDMAKHFKNVITPEIPETYTINPMFGNFSNERNIRKEFLRSETFYSDFCDG